MTPYCCNGGKPFSLPFQSLCGTFCLGYQRIGSGNFHHIPIKTALTNASITHSKSFYRTAQDLERSDQRWQPCTK